MLHDPVYGPLVLFLLDTLALVVLLLTAGKCNIHLCASVLINEPQRRHNGKSRILSLFLQLANLTLGKQQLAVTTRRMIGE